MLVKGAPAQMSKILCFVLLWLYDQFIWDFFYQFTHILQGCFTGTGQSTTIAPVPVKSSWRIWLTYDCPNANGVILKNMGKSFRYSTKTKHNQAWTVCIYFFSCYVYTSNSLHSTEGQWLVTIIARSLAVSEWRAPASIQRSMYFSPGA